MNRFLAVFVLKRRDRPAAWTELQQGKKPFVFDHIAPGNYILVFNQADNRAPDAPFGRTFYGDAHDVSQAQRLVVLDTDAVIAADIHVGGGAETRKIKVSVVDVDGQPYKDAYLSLKPGAGFPLLQTDGVYTINLFKGTTYEVTAKSFCLLMPGVPCPKQKVEMQKR